MGNVFLQVTQNIKITKQAPPDERFDFLRPEGITTYTIDRMYEIPKIKINFNG